MQHLKRQKEMRNKVVLEKERETEREETKRQK